jgi:hypothetical protein
MFGSHDRFYLGDSTSPSTPSVIYYRVQNPHPSHLDFVDPSNTLFSFNLSDARAGEGRW